METSRKNPVTLVSAKAVSGGKITLTFTQMVERDNRSQSLTSLLNADDERFQQAKPRYAFITGSPALVKDLFNIDCASLKEGESIEIDQVEPLVKGELLNIQLVETVKGTDWQMANLEKAAKRAGKDGDFIMTEKGEYIFVKAEIAVGQPNNYSFPNTKRLAVGADVTSAIDSIIDGEK